MKRIFSKNFKITQNFNKNHLGLDIVGLEDKEIVSPVKGVVKSSLLITDKSNLTWEWGNYIRIDDENNNRYYFCHLDKRYLKVGDKVNIGTKIGLMGNTGKSFGAHCHFEIRTKENVRINPSQFLEIPNEKAVYKWAKTVNGWSYGAFKDEWGYIDDKWYYFNGNSAVTGFFKVDNKNYYFAENSFLNIKECQLIITDKKGAII